MSKGPTRWGFMGCGRIASDFATAMKLLPKEEHQIVAVAAGDLKRAQEFADKFGVKQAFDSYEQLANCPDVDIVYVCNLTPSHLKCTKLALNGGKAVLVEKAMAMNSKQVQEMAKLARSKSLFLMEGFWSRFFPIYGDIRKALKDGTIGEPMFLQGSFGKQNDSAELARMYKKELGRGTLLDFGCYLVNAATMIFGGQRPESVHAIGKLTDDGIDAMDCVTLKYKNGAVAQLMMSSEVSMGQNVCVFGANGQLEILKKFHAPTKMILNSKEIHHPLPETKDRFNYSNTQGMIYQMKCVRDCLLAGHKECPIMPMEHSIVIMEIMDEIRRQVGVVYPEDEQ